MCMTNKTVPIFLNSIRNSEKCSKVIKFTTIDHFDKLLANDLFERQRYEITEICKTVQQSLDKLELLIELLDNSLKQNSQIAIQCICGKTEICMVSDIRHLESDGQVTHFHLTNNRKFVGNKNIGFYKQNFCNFFNFFQISQGSVFNLHYLKSYCHKSRIIELQDDIELVASRQGGKELKEYLRKGLLKKNNIEEWANFLRLIGISP